MNVNVMDYSATIRAYLENESSVWDELKAFAVEKDSLIDSMANVNICCSNDSYIFVYVEKIASFIAISLNKLCKSNNEKPFFQCLSVNAAPIGQIKKCLINKSGTYILLVYDKSLSAIQLPAKWGKFEQYGNGKHNLICRSVQFNIKSDIVDALWHPNAQDDIIICLAKDNLLRFFSVENQNVQIKKFNLNTISNQNALNESANRSLTNKTESSDVVAKIELGKRFLFNSKKATPIFLLKVDGQIDCLIEYESSKGFEYLSALPIVPFTLDVDTENARVVSIMSTKTKPNCLVLLWSNGLIYHCLFLPNRKATLDEQEEGNLEAEAASETDDEAVLFIYESIRLEDDVDLKSVAFINDTTNPFRYFICHSAGIHLVHLTWLEELENDVKNNDNFEFNEFDETSTCEISHLLSTKSVSQSQCHLSGFTVLREFSRGPDMLIVLTNHFKFIFPHIQTLSSGTETPLDLNSSRDVYASRTDQFSGYIKSILKREISLPILKSENDSKLNDDLLLSNMINLIKYEYIEKQRKVMHEFQNRYNLLKKQEKIQAETLKEITQRIQALNERKKTLLTRAEQLSKRQQGYEERIENRFSTISKSHSMPMTEYEIKMLKELDSIKTVANDYEKQIGKVKAFIKPIVADPGARFERKEAELDEHEIVQIKSLMKNEAEKIKDLMSKVEKLKLTTERMKP